jgi:hypothetical protein
MAVSSPFRVVWRVGSAVGGVVAGLAGRCRPRSGGVARRLVPGLGDRWLATRAGVGRSAPVDADNSRRVRGGALGVAVVVGGAVQKLSCHEMTIKVIVLHEFP